MKSKRSHPQESLRLYLLAGALLLGGPTWNYLHTNGYGYQRPETFVLPLAAAIAGAVISMLAWWLGRLAAGVILGLLVFVFLDLQFDIAASGARMLFLVVSCVAISFVLASRRALLICVTLAAFNLASLASRSTEPAVAQSNETAVPSAPRPMLVHIVLDEQWGVGGIRAAGDSALASYLSAFYLDNGFQVVEQAYSRFSSTAPSLGSLMSLGHRVNAERVSPTRFRLRSNPYFERLQQLGYTISVQQTSFFDYCHAEGVTIQSCEESAAVSVANIGHLGGSWRTRAALTARYMLNSSSHLYTRIHGSDGSGARRSYAGRGLSLLARTRELIASGAADAIFVHVLLPHKPLEVDSTCRPYPASVRRVAYDRFGALDDAEWERRLKMYNAQVRCVHSAIAEVIAAVDSVAGRDGSIILIHGDHGSRLSRTESTDGLDSMDAERLNAVYSTLLAVRLPGLRAAIHRQPVPLQDFFWDLVRDEFRMPTLRSWSPLVYNDTVPFAAPAETRLLTSGEMLWVTR